MSPNITTDERTLRTAILRFLHASPIKGKTLEAEIGVSIGCKDVTTVLVAMDALARNGSIEWERGKSATITAAGLAKLEIATRPNGDLAAAARQRVLDQFGAFNGKQDPAFNLLPIDESEWERATRKENVTARIVRAFLESQLDHARISLAPLEGEDAQALDARLRKAASRCRAYIREKTISGVEVVAGTDALLFRKARPPAAREDSS